MKCIAVVVMMAFIATASASYASSYAWGSQSYGAQPLAHGTHWAPAVHSSHWGAPVSYAKHWPASSYWNGHHNGYSGSHGYAGYGGNYGYSGNHGYAGSYAKHYAVAPVHYAAPAHYAHAAPIAHAVIPHGAKYTAITPGAVHTAPLPGHALSQTALNVAAPAGTWY